MKKDFIKDLLKDIKTKDELVIAFNFYKANYKITENVKKVFGDKFYELLNEDEKTLEIIKASKNTKKFIY